MEVTRTLAHYIVQSKFSDIPQSVRHEAARAILNYCGCAIGSSRHETIDNLMRAILQISGAGQAGILGRKERLDISNAALINGVSAHVFDFDDTHVRAIHVSAPVLPALLAFGELHQVSGADLVHAFIVGVETECRVGLSVFPEHYMVGWHITGTAGIFGAAAAVGKLLGLNELQMTWALGIAATQSSGLREMFGSMCKSLHPGRAAQGGLVAALMAKQNFTSSESGIEAPRGFANVMSTKFDPEVITRPWGQSYELSSNMYKPFACGLVVHGAIDGCIQLRNEHALTPEQIDRVEIKVCPIVMELTAKQNPMSGLEGKFSVYHAAAVALVEGAAGEAQFSDSAVIDPQVIALRKRITAIPDPVLQRTQADVFIYLKTGAVLNRRVEHALGTLDRPMSDADLEGKFRALSTGILSDQKIDAVIELCWSIQDLSDVGQITRAASAD